MTSVKRIPKKLLTGLTALLAVAAVAAPGASAATEVGSTCAGTTGGGGITAVPISFAPGSPLPLTAPTDGVVTKWKVNNGLALPPGFTFGQRMRVVRPTAVANEFQTVAESELGLVAAGSNSFLTRIPVQAGDRFGAFAGPGSIVLFCPTPNVTDVIGIKEGDITVGSSATYAPAENLQLAMAVTIEPDADKDGFGDETQDSCPQNAALQKPCPVLKLKAFGIPPGKRSVVVLVTSDAQSAITVSASAKVKGKKGKGTTTATLSPVVQLVSPGEIIAYTINYNKALIDALKALPAKKSLTLDIVAEGKSLGGATSSERLTVKVKGQKKARKKAKKG